MIYQLDGSQQYLPDVIYSESAILCVYRITSGFNERDLFLSRIRGSYIITWSDKAYNSATNRGQVNCPILFLPEKSTSEVMWDQD